MDPFETGGGMNSTFYLNGEVDYRLAPAKFEAGTQNIAGIIAFGKAIDFIESIGIEQIHAHDVELIKYAKEKLKGYDKIKIYNPSSNSGIITFNIEGVVIVDA